MYKLLLLLVLLPVAVCPCRAQSDTAATPMYFTLSGGTDLAHEAGASVGATLTVYPKHLPLGFGIHGRIVGYRAAETPSDYIRYVSGIKIFDFGFDDPRDQMYFAALTASRMAPIKPMNAGGRGSYFRFDLGPSLAHHIMKHFFDWQAGSYTSPDYAVSTTSRRLLGLYADIQWSARLGRGASMGLGLWGNWTARAVPVGLDLRLSFGRRQATSQERPVWE